MKNGLELYKRIGNRETANQKWNDLSDEERLGYIRLAEGVEVSVKRGESVKDIAKYLMLYVSINRKGE